MRRWPKSFVSSEIQVKTTLRYHGTPFEQLGFVSCGLKWQFILSQSENQKSKIKVSAVLSETREEIFFASLRF